jgi:hypothetical protein
MLSIPRVFQTYLKHPSLLEQKQQKGQKRLINHLQNRGGWALLRNTSDENWREKKKQPALLIIKKVLRWLKQTDKGTKGPPIEALSSHEKTPHQGSIHSNGKTWGRNAFPCPSNIPRRGQKWLK